MNITLHIERLVLDGIPIGYSQRPLLQAAVEAELTRLMAEGGLTQEFHSGGALASVRAGGIQLTIEKSPTQLGAQIAQALYQGIGR